MATSMLLQAATPRALTEQKNQMYTMLQAPSIGGVRRFGAAQRGYGVCSRRRSVLIGFRVRSGLFTLPGTKKVKKDESEDTQDTEPDVKMGTRKIRKSPLPGTIKLGKGKKDNNVVFVAGATGKVGRRVVRELLESGFQVRAGVRDISKGQALLEMLDETKSLDEAPKSWAAKLFKPRTPSKSERLELVECDLEKDDAIENSLGNAGVVVCAIGASEKEVLDTTGPYRIDFKATVNLVKAASSAKVNHFILVTSLGTTKFGWPASVLNLFWGVLIWKAKAEKALEESGLPYTIVRPGGMERPTDAYKETHNLVLAPKDTYSGGQVSSLQVAELIASCVSNLDLAKFKVLEAIAETTAPLRPIEDLLADVPALTEDDVEETRSSEPVPSPTRRDFKLFRQQEEKSRKKAEADEKKKKDLQEKSRKAAEVDEKRKIDLEEKTRKTAEADQKRKKEMLARYERDLLAAREEEEEAKQKAEEALLLKAQLEKRTADLQVQARTAAREVKKAKALENAMVTAARQGRRLSEKEKVEVLEAAAAEFDGESKSSTVSKKVTEAESKISAESTNSKPEKGLKFKAMQAAKLKEADDRAAKKFAENARIAEQAKVEKEEKERVKKEEMARLENEIKAKAEAEAKAKAEADAKAKAEADAKAKAEADAKAKAEADAKAKAEADAKAKAIAEAKAKADGEAKAKAEAEAKAKAEAEAKANAEQEENDAKAKLEAEANAQAEKDRAIKAEAEAKAKEDAEATARSKQEALVDKAKNAKEEAATRAAIALEKAKGAAFRWPWQKRSIEDEEPLETPVLNTSLNEDEDAPLQVDSKPEDALPAEVDSKPEASTSNSGIEQNIGTSEDVIEKPLNIANELTTSATKMVDNADSETPPPISAIKEEVPKFTKEVVEDTEALVEKAKKAKEEASTRASIALEKAKRATSGSFQWPWQKGSAIDDLSSETSAVNESSKDDANEDVDPKTTLSSTKSKDSKDIGTLEGSEEVQDQSSNVINGLAVAATEVVEKTEEFLDNTTNNIEERASENKNGVEEQSSENKNGGVPTLVENTSSEDTEPEAPSSIPSIAEERQSVEGMEDSGSKAKNAREEANDRATGALLKAQGNTFKGFKWPWQEE